MRPASCFRLKVTDRKLAKLESDLARLNAERAKWLAPEAEAAIVKIRKDAHDDPTEENIGKLSAESMDELKSRYANAADEIGNIIAAKTREGQALMSEVWAGLRPLLENEMANVEATNRSQAEKYGLVFDREKDQTLKSIARFAANARSLLEGPTTDDAKKAFARGLGCVTTPQRLREIVGPLKARGLFS